MRKGIEEVVETFFLNERTVYGTATAIFWSRYIKIFNTLWKRAHIDDVIVAITYSAPISATNMLSDFMD